MIPAIASPEIRRKILLLSAWIGAVFIIGGSLWFFTQNYRTRLLVDTINKILVEYHGITVEALPGIYSAPASVLGGQWFKVSDSSDSIFLFTILRYGITASCAALIDSNGRVKNIIPLSDNARQLSEGLPLPVYDFYVYRIEQSFNKRHSGRGISQ